MTPATLRAYHARKAIAQAIALDPAGLVAIQAGAPPRDRTTRVEKAVRHCKEEWSKAYDLAQSKGLTAAKALRMASVAYKLAMPKMDSLPAIRAVIACVAQGITLEVFDGRDGSQLLYAAQVAMSTLKPKPTKGKKAA